MMRWPILFPSPEQVAMQRCLTWMRSKDAPVFPSTSDIAKAVGLTRVQTIVMLSKLSERGALVRL